MQNIELIKIFWEELKYRHDLFWRLLFRSVLAVLTLIATPLLYLEQLSKSIHDTKILILFPILAMIVGCITTWIFINELKVVRGVLRTYRALLVSELDQEISKIYNITTTYSGTTISIFFCSASVAVSSLEMLLILIR